MRNTRFSVVAVLLTVALVAVALPLAAQTRGGALTMAYQANTVPDPDPHKTSNIGGHTVSEMISDPIVRYDTDIEEYVPVLAESWEISEDGLVYTFHLRTGVLFHNGVELTADAVVKSYNRIRNPENPLPGAALLSPVKELEAVGPSTVKIVLENVFPDFMANLDRLWILEPGSFTDKADDAFVAGCGPFKIVPAQFAPETQMVLEKFPQYWAGEPYLDRIIIRLIPDMGTALVELERGTVDFVEYVSGKDIPRLQAAGFQPFIFGRINWANIAFNMTTVTDVRLRKAMCYALDQQTVIDGVYGGLGDPMHRIGYPGTWLENTEVGYDYDPEEANRILDAAGWFDTDGDGIREIDGKNINLHFPTRNQDEWMRATQMIQLMYQEVGIGSYITIAERMPFYDGVRTGDYDIAWWLSNDAAEPPIALYTWDMREYWSVHQADTPEFQRLIELAESEMDQDLRADYYKELQRIHFEDAYSAPGMWTKSVHVGSPKLQGFRIGSIGIAYDSHLWWKSAN